MGCAGPGAHPLLSAGPSSSSSTSEAGLVRGGHERVDMLRARTEPANGHRASSLAVTAPPAPCWLPLHPVPSLSCTSPRCIPSLPSLCRSPCGGRSKRMCPSKCMAPWRRPSQGSHRLRGPLWLSCRHSVWWHSCRDASPSAVAGWQEGWLAPREARCPLPPPSAAGTLFTGNAEARVGPGKAARPGHGHVAVGAVRAGDDMGAPVPQSPSLPHHNEQQPWGTCTHRGLGKELWDSHLHQHLTSGPGGRPGIPQALCVDESRVPMAGRRKRASAAKQCSRPAGFLPLCAATATAPAPPGIHSGLFLNPRPGPQHSAQPVFPGHCPSHWGFYCPHS